MGGFVESPDPAGLASLARQRRLPLVEDLGSGALVPTEDLNEVEHEPTPAEVLRGGVHLVTCSGDKLLGGPQAGIIAGAARWIRRLKAEPFFRALRCDKLVLAALQSTTELYLNSSAANSIPTLRMIGQREQALRQRAEAILGALRGLG